MIRQGEINHILMCQRLFHQFAVDMYVKIETERLTYIRLNQRQLRSEEYIHLRDAINADGNVNNVGRMTILPATYIGICTNMLRMLCHMLGIMAAQTYLLHSHVTQIGPKSRGNCYIAKHQLLDMT